MEPDAVSTAEGKSEEGLSTVPHSLKYNLCTGMEITLNNQPKQIAAQDHFTVQQLLHLELPGKQQGIAVAINNQVISKTQWEHTHIREQDNIIIIRATQGG